MKIACYGDSITVGIPGASYFRILQRQLPQHTLLNYGKINDTPLSLHRRIRAKGLLHPVDVAVIYIGVNDLLIERSWFFSRTRHHWAHDDAEFETHYAELLAAVHPYAAQIMLIPPLFIGEDFASAWQKRLGQRAEIIARLGSVYPTAHYLNLRLLFQNLLSGLPVRADIPQNLSQSVVDGLLRTSDATIDHAAAARGLHYTIDGVHLNTAGAQIVADALKEALSPH